MSDDNLKNRMISKAPGVGFEDVHTAHPRELKVGPNLPPSGGSDGEEHVYRRCKQCGFVLDTTKTNPGNPYGNISTLTARPSSSDAITATLGGAVTYAGGSTTTVADYMYGTRITATSAGSVKWVGVYIADPAGAGIDVTVALYKYDGTLVGYTEERTINAAGWYIFRVKVPVNVAKGDELLVLVGSESSFNLYYTGSTGRAVYCAQDYDYFPPSRPSLTASTEDYSIFISYTAGDSFDSQVGAGCPLCGSGEY
jgi:hypothetical protein